jgi:HSP20 family molecular chaperone IbpA
MSGLLRYQNPLDRALDAFFAPVNGSAVVAGGSFDLDVVVTIAVEYRKELDANGKTLWRERSFGRASRAIRLPEAVDANAAQATHTDGVLQLTLPKIAKANSKQITIQ